MMATTSNPAVEFATRLSQLENCVGLMLGVQIAGPGTMAPLPESEYFTFEGEDANSASPSTGNYDLSAALDAHFTRLNRVESLVGAYLSTPVFYGSRRSPA